MLTNSVSSSATPTRARMAPRCSGRSGRNRPVSTPCGTTLIRSVAMPFSASRPPDHVDGVTIGSPLPISCR